MLLVKVIHLLLLPGFFSLSLFSNIFKGIEHKFSFRLPENLLGFAIYKVNFFFRFAFHRNSSHSLSLSFVLWLSRWMKRREKIQKWFNIRHKYQFGGKCARFEKFSRILPLKNRIWKKKLLFYVVWHFRMSTCFASQVINLQVAFLFSSN